MERRCALPTIFVTPAKAHSGPNADEGQVCRDGGGRRAIAETYPEFVPELKRLVEPATSVIRLGGAKVRWTRPLIGVSKSMDKLATALTAMGQPVSADTVTRELVKLGFSRQLNLKADEGFTHPDRNAQFEYSMPKSSRRGSTYERRQLTARR